MRLIVMLLQSIVIFFSHAGDNYSVGNIEVGNTKIVADYIAEITGADQYEIVTHKYDGMAYTLSTWQRKRPIRANCRLTRVRHRTFPSTTPSSSAAPSGGVPIRR